LLDSRFYSAVFFAQLAFYLLAALGTVVSLKPKILMLPFYFTMINAAAFLGFYHAMTHRRSMAWK
jgi:hypothetical protein